MDVGCGCGDKKEKKKKTKNTLPCARFHLDLRFRGRRSFPATAPALRRAIKTILVAKQKMHSNVEKREKNDSIQFGERENWKKKLSLL